MVRHWPYDTDTNVLFTFAKGKRVESLFNCDFIGTRYDKGNDVNKERYKLLGPYLISNWSKEDEST
jgi:hypothetical protein